MLKSASHDNDEDEYLFSEYLLRNYHAACARYWIILSDILEKRRCQNICTCNL